MLGLAAAVLVAAAGAVALLRGTAPTVAAFAPSSAEPVPANAGISITFDAPMDRASVERALTVEPATELTYGWTGNTVEVRPATGGWARGTSYTVRLDRGARSVFFAPLDMPRSFSFLTATPLAVRATYPSSSASEVEVESAIAVQFTNPVVPLALRASTFDPLRLEPPVEGKGTWITSSTYLFRPAAPLRPATRYVATVPKGVADTTGDGLIADATWAFTTRSPAVESVEPADDARFVDTAG
ncbi:MAG TPA: Ig-like domain-containing protein, partial [Chloroflexota bacterium]|nr:Ig-like domain-containing protein [Chloroflexota bacterium]